MIAEDYAIIVNLMYNRVFADPENNGLTVARIIDERPLAASPPNASDEEIWARIIRYAHNNKEIARLVLGCAHESRTGGKMAVFSDVARGVYIAACAGTGATQWRDDALGGNTILTGEQRMELDWFWRTANEPAYAGVKFVVIGHSNGGNAASLVALLFASRVAQCYSFDGQGISPQLAAALGALGVTLPCARIHLYATGRSPVNALLFPVYASAYFTEAPISEVSTVWHAPELTLDITEEPGGEVRVAFRPPMTVDGRAERGAMAKFATGFSQYVITHATYGEEKVILSTLGELLTMLIGKGDTRLDILTLLGNDALLLLLRYLEDYLAQSGSPTTGIASIDDIIERARALLSPGGKPNVYDMIRGLGNIVSPVGTIRDYSDETGHMLIDTARAIDAEKWWDARRWDAWYRLEELGTRVFPLKDFRNASDYHRKILDIHGAGEQRIQRIFTQAKAIDRDHGAKLRTCEDYLAHCAARVRAVATQSQSML
jgi:hypothetical protein